jgi:signal transduction histidine kinase/AraC-like DNA-binding protein
MRNEAIFIPNTQRSPRFPLDPRWPNTRARVVLPIRLGQEILGVLDLHSNQSALRTRQELVGLQSLADQLGVAMQNARLYGDAVQARTSAEKADQLKTRLLANVSHELRTPLNVILGYIQTALTSPNPYKVDIPPELLKDLQHIGRNADHLLHVINDLLDLSRAEIDELDLQPEIIELHSFLVDVFDSIAESVDVSDTVAWRLQLPDRLPSIQADPVRLRQILLNLLSNAAKFTEQGQIVLGADVTPPYMHIWVEDTGQGIPAEQQERIFEPFITAQHQSRQSEGIGLGLSITRRLVSLHRGTMTLESKQNQGSTFHIYLPLPTLSEQPATLSASLTQPVLLLVSGCDQVASEIINLSDSQNLEIRRLQPDDKLVTILTEAHPAVIAWDLASATPDDWPIVQQLRHHAQLSQIPFILYGNDEAENGELPPGLTNLVPKPVTGKTLTKAISAMAPVQPVNPILIVDDDSQALELYQEMVSVGLPDHPVRTADNGSAALNVMQEILPGLVILDLMMPGMDGFEVLDWMRANPRTRQIPVLILSGRMLTFDDIKRLEQHTRTTFQSKDILSGEETAATVQRILLDEDMLPTHTSALVKRTVAYLHQNFQEPLSREEIARAVGVSKNYLSHIFRRELGLSPWDYLNRYRIKQARELLTHTDVSITDVAYQVGFNNPAYFSRVFHQQTGVSPSEYRENQ